MKILIVGAGKLGVYLASFLEEKGHEVDIIENDRDRLNRVLKYNTFNITLGDATDTRVLEESDIEDADVFISTTSNGEMNMILCLMAKKLGAKKTICICDNDKYLDHVEFMGEILNIDLIINQKLETARYILREIYSPEVIRVDTIDHGKMRMVEMKVGEKDEMASHSLLELSNILPKNMLVAGISRDSKVIIPRGNDRIIEGDIIHLISSNDNFIKFFGRRNGISPGETFFIISGGLLTYFLVERLERFGHQVKVLEKDKDLINLLRRDFPNCEAVYDEGFDINALERENITDYENLILLSKTDEINFALSQIAKNIGVKKIYASIYSKNLLKNISSNCIDLAFSEQEVVLNIIKNFIEINDSFEDAKVGTLKNISKSKIKIDEVLVDKESKYVNRLISDIHMPEDRLIAFVARKNKILIPNGDDIIKPKDVLIIISERV